MEYMGAPANQMQLPFNALKSEADADGAPKGEEKLMPQLTTYPNPMPELPPKEEDTEEDTKADGEMDVCACGLPQIRCINFQHP